MQNACAMQRVPEPMSIPFGFCPAGFISRQLLKAAMQLCLALVCAALWHATNRRVERATSFRQKVHASDIALSSMIDLEARASGAYHGSGRLYSPRAPLVWHPGLKRLLVSEWCLTVANSMLVLVRP